MISESELSCPCLLYDISRRCIQQIGNAHDDPGARDWLLPKLMLPAASSSLWHPEGVTANMLRCSKGTAYPLASRMGRIAWGPNRNPDDCFMTVIREVDAYYDAGGAQSDASGAITVVGAVSTEKKWTRFEREWNRVLQSEGIETFHMTDYVHTKNAFRGWGGRNQEERRDAFLDQLISVMKQGVLKCFSLTLLLEAYEEVDREYVISEAFGPGHPRSGAYAVCAGSCMSILSEWVVGEYPKAQIIHTHEHGDAGQGALLKYLEHYSLPHFRGTTFLTKCDASGRYIRQFECVDMIAWEHRNRHLQVREASIPTPRKSMRRIAEMIPCQALFHEAETLRQACRSQPELFPPREVA